MVKGTIIHALFALALLVFIATGLRGIDFGHHWDEQKITHSVSRSLVTNKPIPRWYNYPSVCYDIGLAAVMPDVAWNACKRLLHRETSKVSDFADSYEFKLRLRVIFILLVSLSLVWVYILVFVWRNDPLEAFIGSALLGSSWQVAYHARWIAPDALLMQFSIMTMLLLLLALKRNSILMLRLSSVAVGICVGTKYPAGLLLAPLLLTAHRIMKIRSLAEPQNSRREYAILLLIFLGTFVLTTPGMLAQPPIFIKNVLREIRHYHTGHRGYTVESPLEHLYLMGLYLSTVLFSPSKPIALVFFAFACLGACWIMRYERATGAWFLIAPTLYIAMFANQKVMAVRNLLLLAPFLAILSARGIVFLLRRLPRWGLRAAASAALAAMLAVNYSWLVTSSNAICHRKEIDHRKNILNYIATHPDRSFVMTRSVLALLPDGAALGDRAGGDQLYILSSDDVSERKRWLANRNGLYDVVSGSYEIDLNYYPSWSGDLRIVAVNGITASRLGISTATWPVCTARGNR